MIATKFQRLSHVFERMQHGETSGETARRLGVSEIEDGGHLPEVETTKRITQPSIHDSNEISTAIPMFSGSGNTERLMGILSDVRVCRKSKMTTINRK